MRMSARAKSRQERERHFAFLADEFGYQRTYHEYGKRSGYGIAYSGHSRQPVVAILWTAGQPVTVTGGGSGLADPATAAGHPPPPEAAPHYQPPGSAVLAALVAELRSHADDGLFAGDQTRLDALHRQAVAKAAEPAREDVNPMVVGGDDDVGILGFASREEAERTLRWLNDAVDYGDMVEIAVEKPYMTGFEERWFEFGTSIWRYVAPDPPFPGLPAKISMQGPE